MVSENNFQTYFLVTPDKMITTHLPDDENWQLLKKPYSIEMFKELPYIYDGYKNDYYLLDYFPKKNIEQQYNKDNLRFGLKIHRKAKDKYTLILKEGENSEIIASSDKINKNGYLIINYILEKEKALEEIYIYIKKNNEQEQKLAMYLIK